MKIVRDSKYRHVYGEAFKQKYEDLRPSSNTTESIGVRGNSKFHALAWQSGGGGSLAVLNSKQFGRLGPGVSLINGHSGAILDFEFNPFNECIIATASEDTTLKVWKVPEDGLKSNMREPLVSLEKHSKKVQFCTFNPSAEYIIASSAFDSVIKVWDMSEQEEVCGLTVPDQVMALKWNYNGSLLAATCKDKKLRIFDPRAGVCVGASKVHEGVKASKLAWIGHPTNSNECQKLITTGFSQQSERQCSLWDMRLFSETGDGVEPITTKNMEQGIGAIFPFYDEGTGLLFIAGKGDANVRYFEVTGDDMHYISDYRSGTQQRGLTFLPKHCCDTSKHEIMRGLKLESNCIQPISFRVPRRSESFQEDIFPDAPGMIPACSNEEWNAGAVVPPRLRSMRPGTEEVQMQASGSGVMSLKDTKAALVEAKARIVELEAEVAALKAELGR